MRELIIYLQCGVGEIVMHILYCHKKVSDKSKHKSSVYPLMIYDGLPVSSDLLTQFVLK